VKPAEKIACYRRSGICLNDFEKRLWQTALRKKHSVPHRRAMTTIKPLHSRIRNGQTRPGDDRRFAKALG
jgi:hypothetical protein